MEKMSSNNIAKEFENLRKKLLDLTLRNQLLNFKPRAKTIEVANQSPGSIYQTLILEKKKMQFLPKKKEKKDENKNKNKSKFSSLWDHPPIDLGIFKEGDTSLKTNFSPKELQKRLFYINQQAKTMVQEQGYNILYLAMGFLEWRTNYKPNEVNFAPLILIPVDIKRKKVGKSFSICWNGEDLKSNISLQAKLYDEGIILPDFKQTPYIEGIEHYLKDVKKSVSMMKDWKVTNHISLGFFSFTKFVMYNDLNPESWQNNVDLTKHDLIEAIFNPSKNKYEESFNEEEIDNKLHYEHMYQVLDADSSQIAAIEDVKAGRNLVVEGPPGTGKSQTIVNLIAELLATGKSVLFVSEKMAALEVVKNRLDSVGLGDFVLELHSHKTRRKKFLKELEKTLNVKSIDELNMDQIFRKLESLKIQLDSYAEIIHTPMHKVKLSPFQLYGLKESADDFFHKKNLIMPLVKFESPDNITLADLDDMVIELENLAEIYNTISKKNPWSYCNPKSLLPSDLREIELLINDSIAALDDFNQESIHLHDSYGIKISTSLKSYEKTLKALQLLDGEKIELIDGKILKNKQWLLNSRKAYNLIEKLEKYQSLSKTLKKFNDTILNEDLDFLISEITRSVNKKFRLFGGNSYKELFTPLYKTKVPNDKTVLSDLKKIKTLIDVGKSIEREEELAEGFFGELWHLNAKVTDLKKVAIWIKDFNQLIKDEIFTSSTIEILINGLFDVNISYEMKNYVLSGNKFKNILKTLESKLNPRSKLIFKKETEDVTFDNWRKQLNTWKGQLSSLHLWSQYLNTKNACLKSRSSLFIKSIEKRNIKKEEVKFLIFGNFADSLLNLIFTENKTLATFIGELHEDRIFEFKEYDRKVLELNKKRIFQKLSNNLPKVYGATDDLEAKVLAGEFTRKRGHLPVRKLLEKAGGLIKQIKPCFMMSPLSIAQYLDPTNSNLQFDVVIFDEASQVKPEDALGAFMRAKTAVVMGDTQQLPPTSFFDQIIAGDGDEEVATALDMESILHLCKLSFPVRMLKWHYRSRHESLIAVSNKEFYDNQLLVYPSPSHNIDSLGLKFKYNPDTYYDRGKSAANREEAKEVVKEIFKHFNKYGDTKSLGVGTFSVSQMNAILEELEIERKQHPELEPLFSEKKNERFFVKNLETIQGDERDVILISVGYGFDKDGKMSLNFGPLNQDGGERRLNVLISRAKEKCVVFSNFKSMDIHLSSNPPFGVKALKEFLEFAEKISIGNAKKIEKEEEPFEDAIYNFLVENGYKVDEQVGFAGFRVDLAIVDDNNPGRYILGIECDGKMYSSSKVARDRDRLREQILTGLGWNLYHLWSTDWYRNRDLAREKLLNHIEKMKTVSFIEETKDLKYQEKTEEDGLNIVDSIEDDDLVQDSFGFEPTQTHSPEDSLATDELLATEQTHPHFSQDLLTSDQIPPNSPEDFLATEDSLVSGNPKVSEDFLATEDSSVSDNPKVSEDFLATEDSLVSDNPKVSEDFLATEDSLVSDNPKVSEDYYHDTSEIVHFNEANDFNNSVKKIVQLNDRNNFKNHENKEIEKPNENNSFHENYETSNLNEKNHCDNFDKTENKQNHDKNYFKNYSNNDLKITKVNNDFNNDEIIDFNNDDEISDFNNDDEIIDFYKPKEKNTNEKDENFEIDETCSFNDLNNSLKNKHSNYNNYNKYNNSDNNSNSNNNNNNLNNNLNFENKNKIEESEKIQGVRFRSHLNVDLCDNFKEKHNDNKDSMYESEQTENSTEIDYSKLNNSNSKNSNSNNINKNHFNNEINHDFEYEDIIESMDSSNSNHNLKPLFKKESRINSKNYKKNNKDYIKENIDLSDENRNVNKNLIEEVQNNFEKRNFNDLDNKENFENLEVVDNNESTINGNGKFENLDENHSYNSSASRENPFNDLNSGFEQSSNDPESFEEKIHLVTESISEIKSEMKNISETISEIENKKAPKNIFIINKSKSNEIDSDNDFDTSIVSKDQESFKETINDYELNDDELENIIQEINGKYHGKNDVLKVEINNNLSKEKKIEEYLIPYTVASDIPIKKPEDLYDNSIKELSSIVDEIVFIEGPIHINEVIVRIRESCNIKRTGSKIKKIINLAIASSEHKGSIINIEDFLFQNDWSNIPIRIRKKPNIDLIANEEIEENIKLILSFNEPINQNDLVKIAAKNFGFKATSQKTANKINSIIEYMIINGDLINLDGKIRFFKD